MSPNNHYCLEVGTEELPAGFLLQQQRSLTDTLRKQLLTVGLDDSVKLKLFLTPRRIGVLLSNIPNKQADQTVELKGPPARIAFDSEGQPTKAAESFCKKNGLSLEAIRQGIPEGGKEPCLLAEQFIEGQPYASLLPSLLLHTITSLEGPRFMRWASYERLFPRPIRWITSVWNDTLAPVTLDLKGETLTASQRTRGHRLLAQEAELLLPSAQSYESTLEQDGGVMPCPVKRRAVIQEQLAAKSAALKASPVEADSLLDEVTHLVEWPTAMVGDFDAQYLSVPKPVLITVLQTHQRYFPLVKADGQLLNRFVFIANARPEAEATIVEGNNRVVVPRLDDAEFFLKEDMKRPLSERDEDLKGITFQKGLGSVLDKTQRLKELSEWINKTLSSPADTTQLERAASLCKADLATAMVFEFTELQGEIGAEYAQRQGEGAVVAQAIAEHYRPRFADDDLPESTCGIVLALADRLDTLVAVFSQEKVKMPTGSRDPLGLRRMAAAVLTMTLEKELKLSLIDAAKTAFKKLQGYTQVDEATMLERLSGFMQQRLSSLLEERSLRHDVIEAVSTVACPLTQLSQSVQQMELLQRTLTTDEAKLAPIVEWANRVERILGNQYRPEVTLADCQESLLKDPSEQALFKAFRPLWMARNEASTASALAELSSATTDFFDNVLVNDPDEAVKENRIILLSLMQQVVWQHWGALAAVQLSATEAIPA